MRHNNDLQGFTLQFLGGQEPEPEPQLAMDFGDDDLRRRIEDYNKVAKALRRDRERSRRNRRNPEQEAGRPRRKVRTTITLAKLEEMNSIFKNYLEAQEVNTPLLRA